MAVSRLVVPRAPLALLMLAIGSCAWVAPRAAHAALYEVAAPGDVRGNDTTCEPCATVAGAQVKAAALDGTDTIRLSAATYTTPIVLTPDNPVVLMGQGRESTVVSATGQYPVRAFGVHYLQAMKLTAHNFNVVELADGATLKDVEVKGTTDDGASWAGVVNPGTGTIYVRDSLILMPANVAAGWSTGVKAIGAGTSRVWNSTVGADWALEAADSSTHELRNAELIGRLGVFLDTVGGSLVGWDSILSAQPGATAGLVRQLLSAGEVGTVVLDGSILTPGDAAGRGVQVGVDGGGAATLTVRNSILMGFAAALDLTNDGASTLHASATYSALDPDTLALAGVTSPLGAGIIDNSGAGFSHGFTNLAAGDYFPLKTSVLRDTGTPGALAAGRPTLDRRRAGRLRDGNGDGVRRVDIGPFERQGAPKPKIKPAAKGVARVGRTLTCASKWPMGTGASFTWRWFRAGQPTGISNGTRRTYRLRPLDKGKRVRCRVTALTVDETRHVYAPYRRVLAALR